MTPEEEAADLRRRLRKLIDDRSLGRAEVRERLKALLELKDENEGDEDDGKKEELERD